MVAAAQTTQRRHANSLRSLTSQPHTAVQYNEGSVHEHDVLPQQVNQ